MKNFSLGTLLVISSALFTACSTTKTSTYNMVKATHLKMKEPLPSVGKTISGQEFFLGGFSGLMLTKNKESSDPDNILLTTITDRGPNGFEVGKERPFLLPEFSPQIVNLKVDFKNNSFEVLNTIPLKKRNGKPLTGLPNVRTEENPVDTFGFMYSLDADGLDTEAIVSDDEGGYWVGEEYSPSLVHFDGKGVMLRRLTPFNELPKMYSERKTNRGFEGIAKEQNKIFGFLQSPLPSEQDFSRIVEVDLETMKTSGEYFYDFEKGLDKIGDAISTGNNQFLVIEQNGKKGEKSRKYIYKITLNGTDNHVKKELVIDLGLTPFKDIEKVEGIALIDHRRIALVNDNDFQIDDKTNFTTGITPLNKSSNEILVLEFANSLL